MEPMDKNYDHNASEDKIYASWDESGAMKADAKSKKKKFTIPLPPPNVTGELHLGHAAMLAIEDIMIRFKKMTGHEALWVPGTDHAAIATENVVLKHLGIKSREEMKREDFLKECRKFATEKHDRIVHQIKKMGAWLDWSREAYTFDEPRNHAVNTMFKKLYDDGLIVRGHRMINWSVGAQSVLSDDEVQYREVQGFLYHYRYFFTDNPKEFVEIATTRPETMFGDTAIAIHPKDKRVKKFVGRKVLIPFVGREIPIIADEHADPKFGTGMLKVTPAHDPNDFAIGERHNLEKIQVIRFDGEMEQSEFVPKAYWNLTREKCRKIISDEKDSGVQKFLVKKVPHLSNIGFCYRSETIVEPMISPQWFISVDKEFKDKFTGKKTTLKKLTAEAVRSGNVKIIPKQFEKVYFHWIDNLRDWCISRQIWWGHRIPVWYDEKEKIVAVGDTKNPDKSWTQDKDTLDTWFSSALWPFSTLGWPDEKAEDFKKFFPTDVLETGHDILFFWVARMIMFSKYATGESPFHTVYLHGLVTDEHGKKMSKSSGNGIDPLKVIDKFGADAVRLSLVVGTGTGQPIPIGESKISGYRNFVNKLWNAGRFTKLQTSNIQTTNEKCEPKSLADKWIASRFTRISKEIKKHLDKYEISMAGDKIYHFVWDDFCDWYIEASKKEPNPDFLYYLFNEILKLAHPLCPFITEKLWQELGNKKIIIEENFPETDYKNKKAEELFEKFQAELTETRKKQADKQANLKEKAKLEKDIPALEARLKNKGYLDKAPAALVEQTKKELKEAKEKLKKL